MPKGEYLQYGGQAIIEGVMMRSPRHFAVAVRAPNGEVVLQAEPLEKTWIGRQRWLKLPFLRGTLALLDAMALGIRAMQFASSVQLEDKYQADAEHDAHAVEHTGLSEEGSRVVQPSLAGGGSIKKIAVGGAMATGLAFGLFLFVFLPNIVGEQLTRAGVTNTTVLNFWSGVLKLVIFLLYIFLISRMAEVKRVFQYHGAEHKAINVLEKDLPLTMENCKAQTRLHPRCGTSFAIIVLLIDIVLLMFVPRYLFPELGIYVNLLIRFGVNLAMLPFIAGIAYELIRFAGKFRNSNLVMALFTPGLMTQYLTTAEPDEKQIEIALVALRACVASEKADEVAPAAEVPQTEETAEAIP